MEPIDYSMNEEQQPAAQVEYAGFWWRFLAALIDGILLAIVGMLLNVLLGLAGVKQMKADPFEMQRIMQGGDWSFPEIYGITWTDFWITQIASFVIGWMYFAIMESSAKQGTLGKMALGITVTDMNGNRLSFARATGRHFAKLISNLTILIGYIIAGFTEKKQALHDMVASTLVLKHYR